MKIWPLVVALTGFAAQAAELSITVLDRNGKPLPDAVVLLDSSMPGPRPAPPAEITIAQEKMRFVPALTVVPLGAKVSFSNLDSWDHHVIAGLMGPGGIYVDAGQNLQLRLAGRVAARPPSSEAKTFTQPGAHLLSCHLHGSMRGHLYVADTPWAKLSAEDGRAAFSGLPEGPARIRVWHAEQLVEMAPQPAQIGTVATLTINTQISARAKRPAPSNSGGSFPY